MRYITSIITLMLLPLCALAAERVTVYSNYCGPFDKLEVTDNVNVVYECNPDSAGYVRYTGARRFADAFILTNSKGKLKVQVNTEDVNDPDLPTLHLYSNFLTSVSNSSERKLEVRSLAPCPQLTVKQIGNGTIAVDGIDSDRVKGIIATGNGQIVLSGVAREAKFVMVGTGTIQADLLRADVVECRVAGTGTIGCWPLESLNVKGLGSTKVYYKGDPVVKKGPGVKVMSLNEVVPSVSASGSPEPDEYTPKRVYPDEEPAQESDEESSEE